MSLGARSARASLLFFFFFFFAQTCGFRGIQMAHALLWSQEKTVVFVFTGLSFFNYSPRHQRAPEVRWDERSEGTLERNGISPDSTPPGPDCQGQMEAATGSRSRALVRSSSSTRYSFFTPSASLSVRNMFCGLVAAVKRWQAVWEKWGETRVQSTPVKHRFSI